jgi:phosphoglycolate phosphatase
MTTEISSSLMGKTMPEIGAVLFPDMTEEARMSIVDDFGDEEVKYLSEHGAVLYDGVEETLSSLERDYDLYIVSNCQDGYVPAFLNAHNMEHHFKDIEMSGRTGMDKGEHIKLLMEGNDIKKAVYVGDTEGDENAARYAGIPFIWASYGFGKAKTPDKVIGNIKDLKLMNLSEIFIIDM